MSEDHKEQVKHPKESASFISKILFCWTLPLFLKGYKKNLTEADLHGPLHSHESTFLGDKLEKEWLKEIKCKHKPNLKKALWKVFGWNISILGVVVLIIELTKLAHPLCLGKLMQFYVPNQTSITKNEAYMYGSFIVLSSLVNVMLGHNHMLENQHLGMKIRVACCSLIYRKSLKLSKTALGITTVGQMVNLLSNDVNRFDSTFIHFHNFWSAPMQIIIITFLLYNLMGVYALAGCGFFVLFIPLQTFLGKKSSNYRLRIALRTDERVRLMNEIIRGIQVIKMYAWEKYFANLIEKARKLEIFEIRATSYIKATHVSFSMFTNRSALFCSILAYVLSGHTLHAYYVFVVTSFYNVLRQSIVIHLPMAITTLAEAFVSIRRIEDFLLYDEVTAKKLEEKDASNNTLKEYTKVIGIYLQNVTAKWVSSKSENTLSEFNFHVNKNELVAVIGTVGSGKSSLLHVILKELPVLHGTIEIHGTMSYSSQEPWLFAGSIKDNILFGQNYDHERYKEVIRACALDKDISQFPQGESTLIGERGATLSGGQKTRINLARAVYREADVYLLDDPLSAVDAQVGKQLFDQCIFDFLKNKCVVLATHQLQYLKNVDRIYILKNGRAERSGTFDELQSNDNGYFSTFLKDENEDENEKVDEEISNLDIGQNTRERIEQMQSGGVKRKIYGKYIKAGGSYCEGVFVILFFIISQLSASFTDYFVTLWVNLEQNKNETITDNSSLITNFFLDSNNCMYFYSGLIVFVISAALLRSMYFMKFCLRASRRLHSYMFSGVVYTSTSFFNDNPSGRILNRFSKDIGSVDEVLPVVILDTLQVGLNGLAVVTLVGYVNPWILIPTVVIGAEFYWLKHFFLASSRDIKRMEAINRSPIFSHLSTSIQGLTTIRTFGAQTKLKTEFDQHQNKHSAAFYMFLACTRAFGFYLDLHTVIYVAFITFSFLFLVNEESAGNVGLSITQSLALTGTFQWGMRQWSELDNQMTSVERVAEYSDLKNECSGRKINLPSGWPENGEIIFRNVCLKYFSDESYVSKNLNFVIKPQEKIGIVGRTGAGKSSLVSALFRLVEAEGAIIIDNVDVKNIALEEFRSKLSIIPQEPVLFSGSLRDNLDPFGKYGDEELWNALKDVDMENAVSRLPLGLSSEVSEGGSNFSVGQRQLLCLARAIIRKNKILILDEATANVDLQTDELIQSTLRKKFKNCTVLTIAHRLHTIMDSDKVLVMDEGKCVEFDEPITLLKHKSGIFYDLVCHTGNNMSKVLTDIAQKVKEKKH